MFAWYLTGEYSDGEIAERLNADGLPKVPDGRRILFRTQGQAPARSLTVFSKDTVRELLHDVRPSGASGAHVSAYVPASSSS